MILLTISMSKNTIGYKATHGDLEQLFQILTLSGSKAENSQQSNPNIYERAKIRNFGIATSKR